MILLLLLFYIKSVASEIGASSDLNCDFSSLCRWRNVTGSADNGDFGISSRLETEPSQHIMPIEENDAGFAYTMGFMGRTVAMLVSEVINCQLGGASLQYWYYKTGPTASLEVCIRQPPGNLEPIGLRCYDGASSNIGRQWSYRAIELPPIGQPFELIFRSYYTPPADIVALDNITYSASLCHGSRYHLERGDAITRLRRSPRFIGTIGIRDWEVYRRSPTYNGELMLIVAQDIAHTTTTLPPAQSTTEEIERNALLGTKFILKDKILQPETKSEPETTTTSLSTTTTSTEQPMTSTSISTSTPTSAKTTEKFVPLTLFTTTAEPTELSSSSSNAIAETAPEPSEPAQNNDSMERFFRFLKQTAPMIPYIPTLVRSLTQLDRPYAAYDPTSVSRENTVPLILPEAPPTLIPEAVETRRSPQVMQPVRATQFYNTETGTQLQTIPLSEDHQGLVELARKAGLISPSDLATTIAPPILTTLQTTINAYGIGTMGGIPASPESATIYPRKLVRSKGPANLLTDEDLVDHKRYESLRKDWNNNDKLHARVFQTATSTMAPIKRPALRPRTNQPPPSATPPLTIFKNPLPVERDVAEKFASFTKALSPGQLDEIKMLRSIPDLDQLVKGMDFSQLKRGQAGFQALKTEFMERLMRRQLGLPIDTNSARIVPKPIVPVKRDFGNFIILESSNSGAEEGAGGTFGDDSDLATPTHNFAKSAHLTDFQGNEISVPSDFAPPPPRDPFSQTSFNRPVHLAAPTASGDEVQSVTSVPRGFSANSNSNVAGPRLGPLFKSKCPSIDCTFDDNKLCNYVTSEKNTSTSNDARSLHDWTLSAQSILNSLTGIPYDLSKQGGSFAYAGGKEVSPLDTFILSSNEPIQILEPSRLDFFVYQAGVKGRLRVCIDSLVECALVLKGSDIDAQAQRWKNYFVELKPGRHVIHFVADKLHDNYAIGLDHIQLLNRLGTAAQRC